MKQIFFLTIIIILAWSSAFSQGEISEDETVVFRNEKSFGMSLNTNGWGLDYKQGKFINAHKTSIFEIEYNFLKNPKEKSKLSLLDPTSRYAYGKLNACFDFRFGIGMQQQLYRKMDLGSVEIRAYTLIGPVLGFMKPIYYKVTYPVDTIERFTPSQQPGTIIGRTSFFYGIEEIKLNPGAFIKVGLGFEHGSTSRSLRSLDVGFTVYAYARRMEILAENKDSRLYFTLFLNYRFGSFLYGRHLKFMNKEKQE